MLLWSEILKIFVLLGGIMGLVIVFSALALWIDGK